MSKPFEDKFDVKYDEKAFEEYSKQVNEYTVNYLSQDLIIKKQKQEIERLNNIINGIDDIIKNHYIVGHTVKNASIDSILKEIKELKEDNK